MTLPPNVTSPSFVQTDKLIIQLNDLAESAVSGTRWTAAQNFVRNVESKVDRRYIEYAVRYAYTNLPAVALDMGESSLEYLLSIHEVEQYIETVEADCVVGTGDPLSDGTIEFDQGRMIVRGALPFGEGQCAGDFANASSSGGGSTRRRLSMSNSQSLGSYTVDNHGLDRIDQRAPGSSNRDYKYQYGDHQGEGVRIYVLDTGIMTDHTDFGGRTLAGWGARNIDEYAAMWMFTTDGYVKGSMCMNSAGGQHGTHVASTAAGSRYGVAKKATVIPVQVLECVTSSMMGWASYILAGMDWVITHDAAHRAALTGAEPPGANRAVVSMSLKYTAANSVSLFTPAVAKLTAAGIPVIAAVGNDNQDAKDSSPANVEGAYAVGALAYSKPLMAPTQDSRWKDGRWGSNHGADVDIFAPGNDILAATYSSTTSATILSGTSMATPHVSGAAARILGMRPDLTVAQVYAALSCMATDDQTILNNPTGTTNKVLYVNLEDEVTLLKCGLALSSPSPPAQPPSQPPWPFCS